MLIWKSISQRQRILKSFEAVKLYDNCNNEVEFDFATETEDGVLEISEIGSSPLTWNTGYKIRGSVVIHDREELIITGSSTVIEFADTRKCGIPTNIIVEYGGKLTISDEAKLTSLEDCPLSMWDGIQLRGDNNERITYQPFLDMSGQSVIENARYGVMAGELAYAEHETFREGECRIKELALEETFEDGGGAMEIDNSIFKNCRFSIAFTPYYSYNGYESHGIIHNGCSFVLDDQIHDYDVVNENGSRIGINTFIKLFDMKNIIIDDNEFNILQGLDAEDRGIGLATFDADYQVTNNDFNNLNKGLIAGATPPSVLTFAVTCNNFTDVNHGMDIRQVDYITVYDNSIVVTEEDHPYGIYLENCTGYQLENNTLSYNSSNWSYDPNGFINYFSSANSNINEINHNSFTDFENAVILEGTHYTTSDHDLGLELRCNEMINYDFAIAVTVGPGIAGVQDGDDANVGANNLFDGCPGTNNDGELFNPNGMNAFNYYHKPDNSPWFVTPVTGCFTAGQVTLHQLTPLDPFDKPTDCAYSSNGCGPRSEIINSTQTANNNTIQRLSENPIDYESMTELEINQAIRQILNDVNYDEPIDSIISLIQNTSPESRKYLLACAYYTIGDSANYISAMNDLIIDSTYLTFSAIMDLKDSTNWPDLRNSVSKKEQLEALAIDSSKYGYTSARNILHFVYGEEFPEIIITPENTPSYSKSALKSNRNVRIYPNPFSNELIVELMTSDNFYNFQLFNLLGTQIFNASLSGGEQYLINTPTLPPGLYLIRISMANQLIYSAKINHLN